MGASAGVGNCGVCGSSTDKTADPATKLIKPTMIPLINDPTGTPICFAPL